MNRSLPSLSACSEPSERPSEPLAILPVLPSCSIALTEFDRLRRSDSPYGVERGVCLKLPLDRLGHQGGIAGVRELNHQDFRGAAGRLERVVVAGAVELQSRIAGDVIDAQAMLRAGLDLELRHRSSEVARAEADVADRAVLLPCGAAVVEDNHRNTARGDLLDDRIERVRKIVADDER